MMRSPLFRDIGAILIALAVLIFLSRGMLRVVQTAPEIHSTLPPKP
jgi:hypothetical protein